MYRDNEPESKVQPHDTQERPHISMILPLEKGWPQYSFCSIYKAE